MSKELEPIISQLNVFITSVNTMRLGDGTYGKTAFTKLYYAQVKALLSELNRTCEWFKCFDSHYNISCNSGERAHRNFKGKDATWQFSHCPYCGGKIEVHNVQN